MITIVRSYWMRDAEPQQDGRYRITEAHVDSEGHEHVNNGLYASDYDPNAELQLRASIIEQGLNASAEGLSDG